MRKIIESRCTTLQQLESGYAQSYLEYLRSKGIKSSTLKQYTSDLHKFFIWLKTYKGSIELKSLRELNDHDFEDYLTHLSNKGYSDATYRRLLSVLNRFLKWFNIHSSVIQDTPRERPLRSLTNNDFISDEEMNILLSSMRKPNNSEARNNLIDRNLAIVSLARNFGFTPRDISSITMDQVNLYQKTILLPTKKGSLTVYIQDEHIQYIRDYLNSIDKQIRPRYQSTDPLFIAYLNTTNRFRFDYDTGKPKVLSVRAIQEMIKDEVQLAELRKMSAKHLRNSCIIEHLSLDKSVEEIATYFRLSGSYSIRRYKEYIHKGSENIFEM